MWVKEEDYLRMDGSTDAQQRRRFTTAFNDPKKTRSHHILWLARIHCEALIYQLNGESKVYCSLYVHTF